MKKFKRDIEHRKQIDKAAWRRREMRRRAKKKAEAKEKLLEKTNPKKAAWLKARKKAAEIEERKEAMDDARLSTEDAQAFARERAWRKRSKSAEKKAAMMVRKKDKYACKGHNENACKVWKEVRQEGP